MRPAPAISHALATRIILVGDSTVSITIDFDGRLKRMKSPVFSIGISSSWVIPSPNIVSSKTSARADSIFDRHTHSRRMVVTAGMPAGTCVTLMSLLRTLGNIASSLLTLS